MQLNPETCYRALQTRDARFDGRFFTAVKSTGVFCRPICPARPPRLENCTFVASAAAAREQGYRPCLRCRPEASPGTPTWFGTSAAVTRALRLIADGALDRGSVDALASRLGLGERHMRRLFLKHLGAPPLAVAQTQRILFAKKLIDETRLPMTEIAAAAGFASIRRFNDSMRKTYQRSPRELRRAVADTPDRSALRLKLSYRPPLDWKTLTGYLALRATPGVETVHGGVYRRTIRIGDDCGWIAVSPVAGREYLVAETYLPGSRGLIQVVERVRRIFDLTAEPHEISEHLARDPRLRRIVKRRSSVRVPGSWDGFELAVRAILGQQVSVKGATTTAGRLARAYGEPLPREVRPAGLNLLFPRPDVLARARLERLGLTRAKAGAIRALARAVVAGELVLDPSSDPEETMDKLRGLPGIGDWTAQYVAMRALDHPDAFPATDLGLRQALGNGADRLPTGRELEAIAERWRPWRAYAAVCLWLAHPPSGTEDEPERGG
jgi:AraC family transcriptional regulator of adaptative response / DNA-3-methyladenine glycosylase II